MSAYGSQVIRIAVTARRRSLDEDRLAGLDRGGVAGLQLLPPAGLSPHRTFAARPRPPAGRPERAPPPVARQDRAFHRLQEPDGAADAVAGVPLPAAPGA